MQSFDVARLEETQKEAESVAVAASWANWSAGQADNHAQKVADLASELAGEQRATAKAEVSLATAQQQTADTLEKAKEAQEVLQRRANPRWLNLVVGFKEFQESMKGKPTHSFEILYRRDDDEGLVFGTDLSDLLQGVGWKPLTGNGVRLLRDEDALPGSDDPAIPLDSRAGVRGRDGVGLGVTRQCPSPSEQHRGDCPWDLYVALKKEANFFADPRLPEGVVRIVIGHRQ